jgi:hypothetical protein
VTWLNSRGSKKAWETIWFKTTYISSSECEIKFLMCKIFNKKTLNLTLGIIDLLIGIKGYNQLPNSLFIERFVYPKKGKLKKLAALF